MRSSSNISQFSVLALASLAWALPAMAQSTASEEAPVEYEDVTVLDESDFSDLSIEAPLLKPSHALLQVRANSHFNPLIELRLDFSHEIAQSVVEVR